MLEKNGRTMFQVDVKLVQVGSKTSQTGSKLAQVDSKFAPSCFQVRPRWAKLAPIWWVGDLGTKTNQMRVSISSSWLRLGEIWPQECMKADIARIYENQ